MPPNFLKPKRDQIERRIRDFELRADQLARDGKHLQADAERRKAERYRRKVLPKSRD